MSTIKRWNGTTWEYVLVTGNGIDKGTTPPVGAVENDLWLDTSDDAFQGTVLDGISARMDAVEPVAQYASWKNKLINGNFDIWQRGTSQTAAGYGSADRFAMWMGNVTFSRQTSGSPVGSQAYGRSTVTVNTGYNDFYQAIESAECLKLHGRTMTFSAKMRRNATMNADMRISIQKNVTADTFGGTWVTIASTTISNASIPTGTTSADWIKASVTGVIPSDGTALGVRIWVQLVAQVPTGSVWDIAQLQLEEGSVATAFEQRPIGIELRLCQRYYYAPFYSTTATYPILCPVFMDTATTFFADIAFPVTMRTVPSLLTTATNLSVGYPAGQAVATLIAYGNGSASNNRLLLSGTVGSAYTANKTYYLYKPNNTENPGFSAEL